MNNIKIIDTFIFFSEINLLKFRLMELQNIVDYFVIVESNKTFSNQPKLYNFESHIAEFQEIFSNTNLLEKIIYVKVEDMPQGDDAWEREAHQRNCIIRGLISIRNISEDDIILISDVDEIPDSDMLYKLKTRQIHYNNPIRLRQEMYYYNLNCKANLPNTTSLMIEFKNLRHFENINKIVRTYWWHTNEKFGWHFSYFGDTEWIVEKIKAFSHQEYNNETFTNQETIQKLIDNCEDLFFRDNKTTHDFNFLKLSDNTYLPKNYKMLLKNEIE